MMLHDKDKRSAVDPRNMRGLEYILGIKETQSNPDEVDLSDVKPVIDMNMEGYARLNDYDRLLECYTSVPVSVAGQQTHTWRCLSVQTPVGLDPQIVVPVSYNFYFWGIKVFLMTDNAGAAAMNGTWQTLEFEMITPLGHNVTKYYSTMKMDSGILHYAPGHYDALPLTRENLYLIPAGCALQFTWWRQFGGNFPANTTVSYSMCGQAVPPGAPIPWGV
jgi:hypothetical protein